jgi:NAD(P)-dependent dehydrogenase (short-subunit alcohol dehydrogenase family)
VGGTSGIGEGIARHLALLRANVIIAGRNSKSAAHLETSFKNINPEGHFEFTPIDLSLISDTRRFARDFLATQKQLHYLIITAGMMRFGGRQETPEGIDDKMAVHFYGRLSLIRELLPILRATAKNEEIPHTVRVLVVLAAAHGKLVHDGDYDLKEHYGLKEAADACSLYNDLMVEELSSQNENITFVGAYPGFVDTNLGRDLPFLARGAFSIMSNFATSKEDCGAYLIAGMLNPAVTGWALLNEKGKVVNVSSAHTPETVKKVMTHSIALIENIPRN